MIKHNKLYNGISKLNILKVVYNKFIEVENTKNT